MVSISDHAKACGLTAGDAVPFDDVRTGVIAENVYHPVTCRVLLRAGIEYDGAHITAIMDMIGADYVMMYPKGNY